MSSLKKTREHNKVFYFMQRKHLTLNSTTFMHIPHITLCDTHDAGSSSKSLLSHKIIKMWNTFLSVISGSRLHCSLNVSICAVLMVNNRYACAMLWAKLLVLWPVFTWYLTNLFIYMCYGIVVLESKNFSFINSTKIL